MIMNRNTTTGIFLIVVGISLMTMVSRFRSEDDAGDFTRQELEILDGADSFMRVLTIEKPRDLAVLRAQSSDFSSEALLSEEFERLSELMVATVTHAVPGRRGHCRSTGGPEPQSGCCSTL